MRDRHMIDTTSLFVTTPKFKKLFEIVLTITLRCIIYQNENENSNLPYKGLIF